MLLKLKIYIKKENVITFYRLGKIKLYNKNNFRIYKKKKNRYQTKHFILCFKNFQLLRLSTLDILKK